MSEKYQGRSNGQLQFDEGPRDRKCLLVSLRLSVSTRIFGKPLLPTPPFCSLKPFTKTLLQYEDQKGFWMRPKPFLQHEKKKKKQKKGVLRLCYEILSCRNQHHYVKTFSQRARKGVTQFLSILNCEYRAINTTITFLPKTTKS